MNACLKQPKPFSVVIPETFKENYRAHAKRIGVDYGLFFNSSGRACIERINPNARYSYIWTTKDEN